MPPSTGAGDLRSTLRAQTSPDKYTLIDELLAKPDDNRKTVEVGAASTAAAGPQEAPPSKS